MTILEYKNIILFAALLLWLLFRNDKKWVRFLGLQLLAASLVEMIGWILIKHTTYENLVVYNVYIILEFFIITKMIMLIGRENSVVKIIGNLSLVLMSIVFFSYALFIESLFVFMNVPLIIGGFLLALQSMVSIFYLGKTESGSLKNTAEFWSLASVLFYFLCFIPVFGLINYIISKQNGVVHQLLTVNDVLFLLRYFLIIISIYVLKKRNLKRI